MAMMQTFTLAVLVKLAADEFKAWTPSIVCRLISLAVRLLPEGERARWQEEWHSHIADIPGEVSKVICALSLLVAARKMSASYSARSFNEVFRRGIDSCIAVVVLIWMAPVLADNCTDHKNGRRTAVGVARKDWPQRARNPYSQISNAQSCI